MIARSLRIGVAVLAVAAMSVVVACKDESTSLSLPPSKKVVRSVRQSFVSPLHGSQLVLDGIADDWRGIKPVALADLKDEVTPEKQIVWKPLRLAADERWLYLFIETQPGVDDLVQMSKDSEDRRWHTFVSIYFDLDNDQKSGSNASFDPRHQQAIGCDRLVRLDVNTAIKYVDRSRMVRGVVRYRLLSLVESSLTDQASSTAKATTSEKDASDAANAMSITTAAPAPTSEGVLVGPKIGDEQDGLPKVTEEIPAVQRGKAVRFDSQQHPAEIVHGLDGIECRIAIDSLQVKPDTTIRLLLYSDMQRGYELKPIQVRVEVRDLPKNGRTVSSRPHADGI